MRKKSILSGLMLLCVALFTFTGCDKMSSFDNAVPNYISLDEESIDLSFGTTYQIKVNTINNLVPCTYQSMDERVVTVDENGLVTAVGPGETGIVIRQDADETGAYKYGQIDLKVNVPAPLTLKAYGKGTINVYFNNYQTEKPICYTIDGKTTAITTDTEIPVKNGDVVYFTSANKTLAPENGGWANLGVQILPQVRTEIYGNVMSLISPDGNYVNNKTITKPFAFYHLFDNAWNIYSNWQYKLELPATTLTRGCYNYMFCNTGIDNISELPATTMAEYCYQGMFASCWNLYQAPELPAKTLAEGCYAFMFAQSGVSNVPGLPATELADWCYQEMFWGCYNLYEAPVLPAKTLKSGCYNRMFAYCNYLNSVTCLATTLSGSGYDTQDWLFEAGEYAWATPTFKKAASNNNWYNVGGWGTTDWGIPSAWNIINAE